MMNLTMAASALTTRNGSIIYRTKAMFSRAHIGDSGYFILLVAEDWGVAQWCMPGSISLKPHRFTVGVTGAGVTVGSTQLEMNPWSLMRRRDERVANYSVLLCTENNLVLLRPSVINLLQL